MRDRRQRQQVTETIDSKKIIYISVGIVLLTVIAFLITFFAYGSQEDLEIGEFEISNTYEASSSLGQSVNEVEESEGYAINTSNLEAENIVEEIENEVVEEEIINQTTVENVQLEEKIEEIIETVLDPKFIYPVEGEIIREFAQDTLVYSVTLDEWVTHLGIDIAADKTTVVKASAEGTIKSIKNDPRYGLTVVIEHVNGYTSIYSNLLTTEFVVEGEFVEQNQTIATVGNTASFEILDPDHLHFEITKDGEHLDPCLIIVN